MKFKVRIPLDFVPGNDADLARCLADPVWRLCSGQLYKIMIKGDDGHDEELVIPFKPNRSQRRLLEKLHYRNIILKARQLGFTTLIAIYFLDCALFRKNIRAGIIAHEEDAAKKIFRDKVKFAYLQLPSALRDAFPLARDNATRQKVMKGLGFAFHHAERFNREVTFLASYRLARQEGESHDKAIDTANDLTWKVHFDYQNTSRPRAMQNDTAKVLLLFRNYSANMLYRLARDVYKSINPKDPAERKEALTQFAGITGMMMLHAGVRGTWFFGIATAIASVFMDDGDDPEEEMKKAMIDAIGPTATGLALNGVPGHALGWDLSGRIGMPDLWFRSSDKQLEGEDAYNYWLSQAAGAAPSMALNAFKGMAMAAKGNVYRGIETAMPKIIKDQMRAYRYMTDGAETMKGDDILPEMTPWEGISQSLGFTPAALTERYKQNSANMNKQEAILAARSSLLSRYYKADEASNEAELDKLDKEIDKFSDKYPEQKITAKTLSRSIRTREKNSDRNVGGINYNEKLKERILNEQSMSIYR